MPESDVPPEAAPSASGLLYADAFSSFEEADYVILSVRLAPNTTGLIGTEEFRTMKKSAYLINVARGGVVDQHALYEALKTGRIAGAAIDVWYNYPEARNDRCLPSDAPLYKLDNLILSPNRSIWTHNMLHGRIEDVAENIRRLDAGRPHEARFE